MLPPGERVHRCERMALWVTERAALDLQAHRSDASDVNPASALRSPALVLLLLLSLPALRCASAASPPSPTTEERLAPVPMLAAPPAAVRLPDAPGLQIEVLAPRLGEAFRATSGIEAIDEVALRRELAECTEAPCPDAMATKYRDARFIVVSSVSRVGRTFLASVRIIEGVRELARSTAQDPDAARSLERAGRDAGAMLRARLLQRGEPAVVAPAITGDMNEAGGDWP